MKKLLIILLFLACIVESSHYLTNKFIRENYYEDCIEYQYKRVNKTYPCFDETYWFDWSYGVAYPDSNFWTRDYDSYNENCRYTCEKSFSNLVMHENNTNFTLTDKEYIYNSTCYNLSAEVVYYQLKNTNHCLKFRLVRSVDKIYI